MRSICMMLRENGDTNKQTMSKKKKYFQDNLRNAVLLNRETPSERKRAGNTHIHLVAVAAFVRHINSFVSQKGGAIGLEVFGALRVRRVLGEPVRCALICASAVVR